MIYWLLFNQILKIGLNRGKLRKKVWQPGLAGKARRRELNIDNFVSAAQCTLGHFSDSQNPDTYMAMKYSVIVAACANSGIGNKGNLPWPRIP